MEILRIRTDVRHYRGVRPGCGMDAWGARRKELLEFAPAPSGWKIEAPFFWASEDLPIADFFDVGDPFLIGVMHGVKRATNLWRAFEECGDLLPIEIEGHGEAFIFRTLFSCEGAIDWNQSKFSRLSNGARVIEKPVFIGRKFPLNRIVRPVEVRSQIFTAYESVSDVKSDYLKLGLTGLQFETMVIV